MLFAAVTELLSRLTRLPAVDEALDALRRGSPSEALAALTSPVKTIVAALAAAEEPSSDLQASLLELSRNLPTEGDDVSEHVRRLESVGPAPRAAPPEKTPPLAAGEIVDLNVKRFLGEK